MQKRKIAICIEDDEYSKRFTGCIMNHYKNMLEFHIFTGCDQLIAKSVGSLDGVIMSDCVSSSEELEEISQKLRIPIIYLIDFEEELCRLQEKRGAVYIVEKYQEVNRIMDEVLSHIGNEIRDVQECGQIHLKTRVVAVYSLAENEFQLPFAMTLGSIICEKERVLVLDLQENSGMTQLLKTEEGQGLEELVIMAENGRCSYGRINSCIGHMDGIDYVFPMVNSESLCDLNASICLKLINMLCQELDYEVILLNLGARFQGFYELLNRCDEIYLMQKRGGLCQWREIEFMSELSNRGYRQMIDRIERIEIPIMSNPIISCERLIEQWRWNEFGDLIRNTVAGARAVG